MQPRPRQRAPKIASPGARRLVLTGVMSVADEFGRERVLLVAEQHGRPDHSADTLQRAIRAGSPTFHPPYRMLPAADAEGVRGEFWFTLPERYRAHWRAEIAALRGLAVRAEVTIRPYAFEQDGVHIMGEALDLAMLAPLPPP